MSGLPFQLSPDPDFYFDSHGHHRALAALRRGLSEASGFTVISGDIGAGKTTAVRAVLRELKPAYFVVAQVVSTQLDGEELLRAISIGFGLPSAPSGEMALAARLRRFFAQLRAERRRAVLVVDEAQNLGLGAFDQLVGLAMRGAPGGRGMQVCLVGQPELQDRLASAEMMAVREQICVSCHLGPIEREETGPYVEHRLRKVGWKGGSTFDAGAIDEIYRWTGGIPRRINMLCSRTLASRMAVNDHSLIDAATVAQVAREQREEIGETAPEPPMLPRLPAAGSSPVRTPPRRPVLLLVSSPSDHAKAAALMAAMADRDVPLTTRLVRVHGDEPLAASIPLFDGPDPGQDPITLDRVAGSAEVVHARLLDEFRHVVETTSAKAVVVLGGGDAMLGCAALARSMGVRVVRVGAGLPAAASPAAGAGASEAARGAADMWYPADERAGRELVASGVAADRIHCAGNLLCDAVRIALRRQAEDPSHLGALHRMVVPMTSQDGRYALVLIEEPKHVADRSSVVALLAFLRGISSSVSLVLVARAGAEREFDKHRLHREIFGERIFHLPAQAYGNHVELLRHATCVLTDSPDVRAEAIELGMPCLAIGIGNRETVPSSPRAPSGGRNVPNWAVWSEPVGDEFRHRQEGPVGARICEHLCTWLRRSKSSTAHLVTERNREQSHAPVTTSPLP